MPSAAAEPGPPRSLADALRKLSDAELITLLRLRPDLAAPAPSDLTTLAGHAGNPASVQRAVDQLDSASLQVLEVLVVAGKPLPLAEVSRLWGAPADRPVERLRCLALVWGQPDSLHLVRAARQAVGSYPAGLGPPLAEALGRRSPARRAALLEDLGLPPAGNTDAALAALADRLGDPATLQELLAGAPDGARAVLDRLTWGPPVGQVADADRAVRVDQAATPVDWLLAHGLLGVVDAGHVILPREVAVALRGGRVHARPDAALPPLVGRSRPARQVEGGAAGAALEAVRLVEALGELWGAAPPAQLRAGGLGVRDLRRTATALDVDDATAALVIEVAYAAGLVAGDAFLDAHLAPTPAYDDWCAAPTGRRWAQLAVAWLATSRVPGLVGTRDERGTPRAAMGPDLNRAAAPALRRQVLDTLAEAPGDLAVDVECLRARLDWLAPRTAGRFRDAVVGWTLSEAAVLGLTGAGAPATPARRLLDAGPEAAAQALDDALPPPLDHVLLQADLTAVAPGPLEADLARELTLLADVESRGGATVYRFTPGSVRRALDAGRSAEEILSLLAARSRTPVPQPLSYLVQDVARRHGLVRVGAASAYVRAEDPALLAELLADRRAHVLRLRRLAPTVLAAQAKPAQVLDVLREIGVAPAAETPDGDVVLRRPAAHRTPPRQAPVPFTGPARPDEVALAAGVRVLRAVDAAGAHRGRAPDPPAGDPPGVLPVAGPARALAVLRETAEQGGSVWIGYVDGDGHVSRRLVRPLAIDGGQVTVVDRSNQDVRVLAAHRVASVGDPIPPH